MKRALLTALCTALVVSMTVPALADHRVGGYFRDRFIIADLSFTKDGNKHPDKLVDQRMRVRWQNNINEYITVVYYGEVDMQWGDASFGKVWSTGAAAGRNDGGALSGDTVNLETKNAYATVKIPDSPVWAGFGLQNLHTADNLIIDDDAGSMQIGAKTDMVDIKLMYSLFFGPATASSKEDGVDFWGLDLGFVPMENAKLTLSGYWRDDHQNPNSPHANLYWFVVSGLYKLDMVNLEANFAYNTGSEANNVDVSGFFANVKASTNVAGANAALRFFFMSGDNDDKDANYFHGAASDLPGGMGGRFSFTLFDGLMILGPNLFANSYTGDAHAFMDAGFTDHGVWGLIGNVAYVPPTLKQMYAKAAIGYFSAVEKSAPRINDDRKGTSVGTEIALHVGYKIAERFDVSLNGSYAVLGNFYDGTGGNGENPDNPYELFAMVNIPY